MKIKYLVAIVILLITIVYLFNPHFVMSGVVKINVPLKYNEQDCIRPDIYLIVTDENVYFGHIVEKGDGKWRMMIDQKSSGWGAAYNLCHPLSIFTSKEEYFEGEGYSRVNMIEDVGISD